MPDLNFGELRQAVESETSIPEFREIRRRAQRHKRWRVLINTARVLGVLIIAAPALAVGDVVLTHVTDPTGGAGVATGGDATGSTGITLGVNTERGQLAPVTRTIVAVDGIDQAHTYALVDVCQSHVCNLQLAQIDPSSPSAVTQETGLLRAAPTDRITDPSLVVENANTVIVSGTDGSTPRQDMTISITPAPGAIANVARPIQTNAQGPIDVVTGGHAIAAVLPNQPPVNQPVLVSTVDGWWVVGTMPGGEIAVSVSRDNGHRWTTHTVGLPADPGAGPTHGAALATWDGQYVLLLVRSGGVTRLLYSSDGGAVWAVRTSEEFSSTSTFGMIMTTGETVIAWFGTAHGFTYLASNDLGVTFTRLSGAAAPTGPIVATGGAFVTLGLTPMTSSDGLTWQSAYVPYVTIAQ
ncbi:MAG TPA: hypothetical protein VGF84_10080 [Micromonosporaceae bacterium]|jgi:hypothetical protein